MKRSKSLPIRPVRNRILAWGTAHYREFPWREIDNPWLALLAEVLLQRTNATHVRRHFDYVRDRFPTPAAVLNADEKQLAVFEDMFGLDRRLKTILEMAQYIDSRDTYPIDQDELIAVYGIGHYTAAAFLSLHMNIRAVLVDANISRWLARMTGNEKPKDVRHCEWLWTLADQLTPRSGFKNYNYAVLDFTMTVCANKKPMCKECPISRYCASSSRIC